eukprot:SAG11_NODE_4062_length_2083_cov_3.086694_2_plen_253_part_00
MKAGELRHIEKWCSLSHDGLLNERRERFLEFVGASFEHAQLAYCCYFWEDMMCEINDLGVTLNAECLDASSPRKEHPDADMLHGLAHTVGLTRGDMIPSNYFDKIPALEATQVAAEAGHLRFKLVPSNAIVPVSMPHATLTGPPGLVSTSETQRNAQLLEQNREILENMKAQQIQVENLVAEVNLLRAQPDAREVAQRAIDATLLEVNQGIRLLSAVRLTKEQESEIRSQDFDVENLVVLSRRCSRWSATLA